MLLNKHAYLWPCVHDTFLCVAMSPLKQCQVNTHQMLLSWGRCPHKSAVKIAEITASRRGVTPFAREYFCYVSQRF